MQVLYVKEQHSAVELLHVFGQEGKDSLPEVKRGAWKHLKPHAFHHVAIPHSGSAAELDVWQRTLQNYAIFGKLNEKRTTQHSIFNTQKFELCVAKPKEEH